MQINTFKEMKDHQEVWRIGNNQEQMHNIREQVKHDLISRGQQTISN